MAEAAEEVECIKLIKNWLKQNVPADSQPADIKRQMMVRIRTIQEASRLV